MSCLIFCLPVNTAWYVCPHACTAWYMFLPACTAWYMCLPACRSWYVYLHAFTVWYMCLHLQHDICAYLHVHHDICAYLHVQHDICAYLHVQHEGKRNQSMNTPAQSLLGSYASNLCHLYFCWQEQSWLHLSVAGWLHVVVTLYVTVLLTNLQISWCIACSNCSLLRIARTLPLLLLAQYGVVTSTLDSHTSYLWYIII